jgi:hypothetical protein
VLQQNKNSKEKREWNLLFSGKQERKKIKGNGNMGGSCDGAVLLFAIREFFEKA